MRVLYFAQARLATGRSEEQLSPSQSLKAKEFEKLLTDKYPSLQPLLPACRLAKNGRFLQPDETLDPPDEVAILPPMSGG